MWFFLKGLRNLNFSAVFSNLDRSFLRFYSKLRFFVWIFSHFFIKDFFNTSIVPGKSTSFLRSQIRRFFLVLKLMSYFTKKRRIKRKRSKTAAFLFLVTRGADLINALQREGRD